MTETSFSERPSATQDGDAEDEPGAPVTPPEAAEPRPAGSEAVQAADLAERAESGDEAAELALAEAGGPDPVVDEAATPEVEHLEDEAREAPQDVDLTDVPTGEATMFEAEPEPEAAPAPEAEPAAPEPEPAASSEPELEEVAVPAPSSGPGEWYVIHTYAGYENKVKANLQSRIGSMQMEDKIFDVVIPMEDVMEIKGGKKQVVQKKVFPGYLLVKMIYDNDSWYVVRNTPGVTGFVSSGTGTKPTPLSHREVEKILAVKQETQIKPQYRLEWEEGDVVRIIAGPFADFTGTIAEINVEQSKLKVMVNIFDRETPVELAFDQVAKA